MPFVLALTVVAYGVPAKADKQLDEIAQKSNNPVSDIWLVLTSNNTSFLKGDFIRGTQVVSSTKLQPVITFPLLSGDYTLVTRTNFSFLSLPFDKEVKEFVNVAPNQFIGQGDLGAVLASPFGRHRGFGDMALLTMFAPRRDSGFMMAAGITQIFPTANDELLGQGKYQIGPAGMIARIGSGHGDPFDIDSWVIGLFPQHWWSVAGPDGRKFTNHSDIQYFISYKATPTWTIGASPEITIDWTADGGFADKVALPIGIGVSNVVRLGKIPFKWGIQGQYYLTGPERVRRQTNIKLFGAVFLPNLLTYKGALAANN